MNVFRTLNYVTSLIEQAKKNSIRATITAEVTINGKSARFEMNTNDILAFEIGTGIKQEYQVESYSSGGVILVGWDDRLNRESKIVVLDSEMEHNGVIHIVNH
jgi:hypothetical protein